MIKVLGDAAFLPLTRKAAHIKRRYALIDLEDYERVSRSKWYASPGGKNLYVHATSLKHLAKHHKLLHAYILRVKPGERVDHINGDTLDNRKQNLRVVTAAQNAQNSRRPTFPGKTSRFKGVSWSRHDGLWLASITANGETHALGRYSNESDAAVAYDEAASKLHGEFARTNAEMNLFEMEDPFVPDCSLADMFDAKVPVKALTPHRHRLDPSNYDQRLTDQIRREIAAH